MNKIVNQYGDVLDIDPQNRIPIQKNNPLFNQSDDLIQDISYAVKTGSTEANDRFWKLARLVESANSSYTQPMQFKVNDETFLTGNITTRIGTDGYEPNLEPNLVAITSLIRNIRLPEIRTEDGIYNLTSIDDLEALMLDSVKNPGKYPFIYFPVLNPSFGDISDGVPAYDYVNNFDATLQKFNAQPPAGPPGGFNVANSPYFKLTYILNQIAYYLGLAPAGSFFTDAQFNTICIYTRQSTGVAQIYPSMYYMPNMLLTDFLKQLRDRLHLAFDIDLTTGLFTVESFRTMANSRTPVDLTPYLTNVIEQELPDQQGYTVTLKSDTQDAMFDVLVNGSDTYPPLWQLTVGDGSNPVELDIGTCIQGAVASGSATGARVPSINQTIINGGWEAFGIPPDISFNGDDVTSLNNWPLRLIDFAGFNEIAPGVFFPEAIPVNLNNDDLSWWQFQNDSKRAIATCNVPPAILARMKATDKFVFKTEGYNYCATILEYFNYDIGMLDELVPVKFYLRTLNFAIETVAQITPVTTAVSSISIGSIKAYFDPLIHGITEVDLTILPDISGTFSVAPITVPANSKGAGGVSMPIIANTFLNQNVQIRITRGAPKYILYAGVRTYFTWSSAGYYYVDIFFGDSISIDGPGSPYIELLDIYVIFF